MKGAVRRMSMDSCVRNIG